MLKGGVIKSTIYHKFERRAVYLLVLVTRVAALSLRGCLFPAFRNFVIEITGVCCTEQVLVRAACLSFTGNILLLVLFKTGHLVAKCKFILL